ncbi:MAG: helix-turn-helix transcriptional regulator [Eubacterium sp.]|jgi:Predicted transcriptional regulators|nr:helix-turn-helix transcriptional regulator [Eubacterium sp.]
MEKGRERTISKECIARLASFFKAVGDENRVSIIYTLAKQEMCVNDIAAAVGISQSLVSHQLRILKLEGFVKARREGKNSFYSLDDQHIVDILDESLKHITHKLEDERK